MNKKLVYAGKSFADFGIRAICQDPFSPPEPDMETTHVNGMDGDLHFYYGSHQNVSITYLCIISRDFKNRYAAFRSWICSLRGYKKLEDFVYPDEFRMAILEEINPKSSSKDPNGFDVTFSCKPQRFLKSGEDILTYTSSGKIRNPTLFDAKPLIRVYGTGQLEVGGETITISSNDGYTDIDCELQDAYHEADNRNENIALSNGEFPKIHPGDSGIKLASGMKAEIKGRWFRK